jgi:hypothetical protein
LKLKEGENKIQQYMIMKLSTCQSMSVLWSSSWLRITTRA